MAGTDTAVYECKVCGSRITVSSEGLKKMAPLYCCGEELKRRKTAAKKKAAARPSGKTVKKTGPAKPAARKKK